MRPQSVAFFVILALAALSRPTNVRADNRVGDADNNGAQETVDAALVQSFLYGWAGSSQLSPLALADGDDRLGLGDLMLVAQIASGAAANVAPYSGSPLIVVAAPSTQNFISQQTPNPVRPFDVAGPLPDTGLVDGLDGLVWEIVEGGLVESTLANASLEVAGGFASAELVPLDTGLSSPVVTTRLTIPILDSSGTPAQTYSGEVADQVSPGSCGDNIVQTLSGEACDDANAVACDGCAADCSRADDICGDSIVECGEDCDDGNAVNDPVCPKYCLFDPPIGDVDGNTYRLDQSLGIIDNPLLFDCALRSVINALPPWDLTFTQVGAQLDVTVEIQGDALVIDNWGLFPYATPPFIQIGDADGFTYTLAGGLLTLQYRNISIEGYFDPIAGTLEDIAINYELATAPLALVLGFDLCDLVSCTPDGYVPLAQTGSTAYYLSPTCPNLSIEPPESCDDGNGNDEDGCSSICRIEFCGDRIIQAGLGEACDDGDPDNGDACTNACQRNVCGDGSVYLGVEECDMGPPNGAGAGCEPGCVTTPASGPAPLPGTRALFSFASLSGGQGFFNFPWPSDLRKNPDDTLALGDFPDPFNNEFIGVNVPIIGAKTKGFGTTSGLYVAFDGPLDPTTFPVDPDATRQAGASIFLMDVDPLSPTQGTRYPVDLYFLAGAGSYTPPNLLVAIPFSGIPLSPSTQYALAVLDTVNDAGGAPLGSSTDFERVKDPTPEGDATLDAAKALYDPVFSYLEASHSIPQSTVRAMTVYTTGDPVGGMFALRSEVDALPTPNYTNLGVTGVENNYFRYWGRYDTPIYQTGVAPYATSGGEIVFDAGGVPQQVGWENIQFMLTTPQEPMPPTGWPVAVYAHGTGGSRYSPLGVDDECAILADNGVALMAINQPLHGDRVPPGSPDPDIVTFNFLNILAGRDNWRQSATDTLQAFRFIRNLTIPAGSSQSGVAEFFDPNRVYFVGHSQGAITGPLALAVEPDFQSAVLSGAGGGLAQSILTKTQPVNIHNLATAVICQDPSAEPLDIAHPLLQLVQTFIEVSDTVNYGRFLIDEPAGARGVDVLMTSGLMDAHSTPETLNAFATAIGMNQIEPVANVIPGLALRGFGSDFTTAIDNRVDGLSGWVTAGVIQYPLGDHFVIYTDIAAQYTYGRFLGSRAYNGTAAICYSPNSDPACSLCGNGALEAGETCDDGNRISGDGCNATCTGGP